MGVKKRNKKKEEKRSKKKENQLKNRWFNDQLLWPDLPQQLLLNPMLFSQRGSTQAFDLCFKGVTKSIRYSGSCTCSNSPKIPALPWLQLPLDIDGAIKAPPKYQYEIFTRRYGRYSVFHCRSSYPEWDSKDPFLCGFLCSPPPNLKSGECFFVLVLTGLTRPAFVYFRKNEETETEICSNYFSARLEEWKKIGWIKEDRAIVDPHCQNPSDRNHFMRFTNGIGFKKKFYALSLQGTLAVIEPVASQLQITALSKKRAVPSLPSMHFRECLLESNEEILLVFLISRKSINIVDDVEVFSLDIDNLTWNKKKTLGDRALFLGFNCCTSASATKVGCRLNCVYFRQQSGWCEYGLDTGTICSSENFPGMNQDD